MKPVFSNDPQPLAFEAQGGGAHSNISTFLGHYDLRVYVSEKAYIDVGRGSIGAALRMTNVSYNLEGCIGEVGQFCDFAVCQLFGGGDHKNELPVNTVMSGVNIFASLIKEKKIDSLSPHTNSHFKIGNAVVVSADAKITSDSVIGDGAVIAANAFVKGDVESFSVYGGLPAKKLKDRVDSATKEALTTVRWWDFDIAYLGNNLHRLQEVAIDTKTQHVYRKPTPRFVIYISPAKGPDEVLTMKILGFLEDGLQKPLAQLPLKAQQYLNQLRNPPPHYWIANVWE